MAKKHWSGYNASGKLTEMWQERDGTWTVGVQGTSLWFGFAPEDKHIALSMFRKLLRHGDMKYDDIKNFPEYNYIL